MDGGDCAPTFTDLEEAAKKALDCRVPLNWSKTQTALKLTGEDMKGKTAGEARGTCDESTGNVLRQHWRDCRRRRRGHSAPSCSTRCCARSGRSLTRDRQARL